LFTQAVRLAKSYSLKDKHIFANNIQIEIHLKHANNILDHKDLKYAAFKRMKDININIYIYIYIILLVYNMVIKISILHLRILRSYDLTP